MPLGSAALISDIFWRRELEAAMVVWLEVQREQVQGKPQWASRAIRRSSWGS